MQQTPAKLLCIEQANVVFSGKILPNFDPKSFSYLSFSSFTKNVVSITNLLSLLVTYRRSPLGIVGYVSFVEIAKSCSYDGCVRIWVHNMASKIVYQTNSMCNIGFRV
jgi:hypothetical protein